MNIKNILIYGLVAFALMFGAQTLSIYVFNKSNNVSKFNVSSEQIAKDLDGRSVAVMFNQVWPFDSSQSITVKPVSKKPLDEYVVVVVDVNAIAPVIQDTPTQKEQFSTNPSSKDAPKPVVKLPSKLQLVGRMKLTYEIIDNEWYLLSADNLTLKANPKD
jgi:hypothetical protein